MDLLILLLPLLLFVLIISRGRRQQRELRAVHDALAPGQEVMTASGLYAEVVEVLPDTVLLRTAPGQTSRWARQAVARIVTPIMDGDPAADLGATGGSSTGGGSDGVTGDVGTAPGSAPAPDDHGTTHRPGGD